MRDSRYERSERGNEEEAGAGVGGSSQGRVAAPMDAGNIVSCTESERRDDERRDERGVRDRGVVVTSERRRCDRESAKRITLKADKKLEQRKRSAVVSRVGRGLRPCGAFARSNCGGSHHGVESWFFGGIVPIGNADRVFVSTYLRGVAGRFAPGVERVRRHRGRNARDLDQRNQGSARSGSRPRPRSRPPPRSGEGQTPRPRSGEGQTPRPRSRWSRGSPPR